MRNQNEINRKISASLKGRSFLTKEQRVAAALKRTEQFLQELPFKDFDTLPRETKRLRVIIEQDFCCAFCRLREWAGQPIVLEMDHEDGNNENDSRDNLRALCPNCHSTTPTWRGRKTAFVSSRLKALQRQQSILVGSSNSKTRR